MANLDKPLGFWPQGFVGHGGTTSWSESSHPFRVINAAGEKFAILCFFTGEELAEVSVPVFAGTQADTITLEIQSANKTGDTVNVTGLPDGTAIANGTASVSNKGGTAEWITFTFGATGPSPSGPHWLVFAPSSAGAFSIDFRGAADWGVDNNFFDLLSTERQYTTAWTGSVFYSTPLRVETKAGGCVENILLGHPPVSTVSETINNRSASNTTAIGVKFTAPYDMDLVGACGMTYPVDYYHFGDLVIVDSADTELARSSPGQAYGWNNIARGVISLFPSSVSLTSGDTYRIFVENPDGDINKSGGFTSATITSGDEALFGLEAGDWEYTYSSTGSAPWTDVATELPFVTLVTRQVPTGGGGGTPTVRKSVVFSG